MDSENGLCFEAIPEEIFTLKLPKLSAQSDGTTLWEWMQFLRSKSKEDFEMIAEKNPEAVDTLYELNADEKIRAEYEQRLKAWRDRQSAIDGALDRGIEIGIDKGIEIGREKEREERYKESVKNLQEYGMAAEQIAAALKLPLATVKQYLS